MMKRLRLQEMRHAEESISFGYIKREPVDEVLSCSWKQNFGNGLNSIIKISARFP